MAPALCRLGARLLLVLAAPLAVALRPSLNLGVSDGHASQVARVANGLSF